MSRTFAATHDTVLPDPLRVHLLCLLRDAQWCRFTFLCQATGVSQDRLKRQFFALRTAGYVDTRRGVGQEGWARLTEHGIRQRDAYLARLAGLAERAAVQIAQDQHEQPDWFAPVSPA
ncbi:transcriptional regulator [Amycolatopsis balhimycina DSM 5908]|uniref:Transcriptional regulator n=1 Tax=Amycolatopsis balhimycina DSM 5908 TaxID=1081091 RepID=A0A428WB73_AMYBA|nr:helix-turn-helix transcriptional regulator [Amycolatopsis balhimycina]RSM40184.1 transcriptional regulator [Amycolatopsis balhimycina DSM 5908]